MNEIKAFNWRKCKTKQLNIKWKISRFDHERKSSWQVIRVAAAAAVTASADNRFQVTDKLNSPHRSFTLSISLTLKTFYFLSLSVSLLFLHLLHINSFEPETTEYSDSLSTNYPPISDAFNKKDYFFCIIQMIQLWHYWEIACSITINKTFFSLL